MSGPVRCGLCKTREMDLGLRERTALVTGGYRGTGAGIARVLAAEGASVLVHGFESGQPDELVAEIRAAGGSATGLVAAVEDLSTLSANWGGPIDVLVNNFGSPEGSSWTSTTKWVDEWQTNVMVGVEAAQSVMTQMRARGWGRIIFIGTVGSRRPGKRNPGYYGAKAALPSIVRTLAMELRGTGVTANLVSPGTVATDEVRAAVMRRAARDGAGGDWESAEKWVLEHRLPNLTERIAEPADVGAVVAFVASEAAWHITGADIAVDGGAVDA